VILSQINKVYLTFFTVQTGDGIDYPIFAILLLHCFYMQGKKTPWKKNLRKISSPSTMNSSSSGSGSGGGIVVVIVVVVVVGRKIIITGHANSRRLEITLLLSS